jgi:hypothetical protein
METNGPLAEAMLSDLGDLSDPRSAYTSGTIFRFFTRAFDRSPTRLSNLFSLSPILTLLIIANFQHPIVWQTIKDLTALPRPQLAPLIFRLFVSLFDEPPPTLAKEQKAVKLVYFVEMWNDVTRPPPEAALEVMGAWFAVTLEDTDDFRQFVLRNLAAVGPKVHGRFALARTIAAGLSNGLIAEADAMAAAAIAAVRAAPDLRETVAAQALEFLAAVPHAVGPADVEGLLAKALLAGPPAHFALRAAVALVQAKQGEVGQAGFERFRAPIGKIVCRCWNERVAGERMLAAHCLDLCVLVRPEWAAELTVAWERIKMTREAQEMTGDHCIDFQRKFAEPEGEFTPWT